MSTSFFAYFGKTLFYDFPTHTNDFISSSAVIFPLVWAPRVIKFPLETISLPHHFPNIGCNNVGSRSLTFLERNDGSMIIMNLVFSQHQHTSSGSSKTWAVENGTLLRSSRNASCQELKFKLNCFIDRYIKISDFGRSGFEFRTA